MPVCHTAFPLELWTWAIFLLVSTLKYSISSNQARSRLSCKNLISFRRGSDPKSCTSWGNATDTLFLPWAMLQNTLKNKSAIFMTGLILLDISESCWGHACLTWILLCFFLLKQLTTLPRVLSTLPLELQGCTHGILVLSVRWLLNRVWILFSGFFVWLVFVWFEVTALDLDA